MNPAGPHEAQAVLTLAIAQQLADETNGEETISN